MPTTRTRHTITETPRVKDALDELRAELGSQRIDLTELVMLGARLKAHKSARTARPPARLASGWPR